MTTLPPRLNESSFRRYEPAIALAVERWPQLTVIDPTPFGLSPTTFAHRMRDAKSSLLQFKWKTHIDIAKLFDINPDFTIRQRTDGLIEVGPPTKALSVIQVEQQQPIRLPPLSLEPLNVSLDIAIVLFGLAHNQALRRPLRMQLSEGMVTSAMQQYDINLAVQPDGTYLLT